MIADRDSASYEWHLKMELGSFCDTSTSNPERIR